MKSLKSCHRPYQVIEGRTQSKTGRIRKNFLLEEGGIGSYWLRYDSHKRKKFKYRIEYVSYDYCTKCENGWNYADTTFADKKVLWGNCRRELLHGRDSEHGAVVLAVDAVPARPTGRRPGRL